MTTPPTVREIAELTARLRELSARGREADPAERAAFLADKRALLDRIPSRPTHPEPSTMSAEEAARRLTGPGRTLDESRALVRDYLDDTSDRVGTPAHLWGLDEFDLTAIESSARCADAVAPVVLRCPEGRPRAECRASRRPARRRGLRRRRLHAGDRAMTRRRSLPRYPASRAQRRRGAGWRLPPAIQRYEPPGPRLAPGDPRRGTR